MWGNTRAVRIPKGIAREVGLEAGTEVTLTPSKAGLLLRPVQRRKSYKLSELLAACKGRNPHREAITGRSGKELF
jgi:antitoxin MazE